MVRYCSYPGCLSRSNKTPGVSFHRFPSDKFRKHAWLTASGISHWSPSHFSHLCSCHFKPEDFKPNSVKGKHLLAGAVPSQFPRPGLSNDLLNIGSGQEHIPERQYNDLNKESLESDNSSYFDPSLFMKATMGVEQNELDIATLSTTALQKQNYWQPVSSRHFNVPTDWQALGKQRMIASTPNAKQMSFSTNNLQQKNQPTCSQVPFAQVQPLNKRYDNDLSLRSTHIEVKMMEEVMKIIMEVEKINVQQKASLNYALRWLKALEEKLKGSSTSC